MGNCLNVLNLINLAAELEEEIEKLGTMARKKKKNQHSSQPNGGRNLKEDGKSWEKQNREFCFRNLFFSKEKDKQVEQENFIRNLIFICLCGIS